MDLIFSDDSEATMMEHPLSALLGLSRQRRRPAAPPPAFLRMVFGGITLRNPRMPRLPDEIVDVIIELVTDGSSIPASRPLLQPRAPTRILALTPPASGASPFMALSTELRRLIFAEYLSDRDQPVHPLCNDDDHNMAIKQKLKDPKHKIDKATNSIYNLMTLNTTICSELGEAMYEERTFVIHVHEGLQFGGVEILYAGRQPLQYQDCIEDTRFAKFSKKELFGFERMKRIVIQIYPTTEHEDRHSAINTYFMNLALCRLLERPTSDKERITNIEIKFVPRRTPATGHTSRAAIMRHEKPWTDGTVPRSSSIHDVTDIELALRPFAMLTCCHAASIELPPYLAGNKRLSDFVVSLEQSMKSRIGTLVPDDTLERKVEQLRQELEVHVQFLRQGHRDAAPIAKLTEKEMVDEDAITDSEEDEGIAFLDGRSPSLASNNIKRSRSPAGPNTRSAAARRNKLANRYTGDEMEGKRLIKGDVGRKTRRSSLSNDPELAKMDEDEQVQLAMQLSTGKTRKELGLSEHPQDTVMDSPTRTKKFGRMPGSNTSFANKIEAIRENREEEESDEEDWKTDLVKQWSDGEVSTEQMEELGVMVPESHAGREVPASLKKQRTPEPSTETGTLPAATSDMMVGIDYGTSTTPASAQAAVGAMDVVNERETTPVFTWPSASDLGAAESFVPSLQPNIQAPRAMGQAQESAIGLLASDDGAECQSDKKRQSQEDDEGMIDEVLRSYDFQ